MTKTAQYWIDHLKLAPHPEGGFFKETYRSALDENFETIGGNRNVSTGIYFLLMAGNFSAFHRIKSDEMWHFYAGNPVEVYVIHLNGNLELIKLGLDLENGEVPQAVVLANCWFGSKVDGDHGLVGCTVAPGFDFQDFEMAEREGLIRDFPQHEKIIIELTRT